MALKAKMQLCHPTGLYHPTLYHPNGLHHLTLHGRLYHLVLAGSKGTEEY